MRRCFVLVMGLWAVAAVVFAQTSPQTPPLATMLNEQVIMLPVGEGFGSTQLETTIFKPNGDGPFPMVVINHGKAPGNPYFQERSRYLMAANAFVARGYLVAVPMRRGFSKSGGGYISPGCNITSNGLMQAEGIREALVTLVKRPDVDPQRIVVIGQSHGGLTTMALGTMPFPGVRGLINFAGGLRMENSSTYCSWEKSLADAMESYARKTTLPSLWFYGDNDSYWGAELPKVMHARYTAAGGKAKLISFGTFEPGDAHGMFGHRAGLDIWLKPVEEFLRSIDMPVAIVPRSLSLAQKAAFGPLLDASLREVHPASNFAALADVEAVPLVRDNCREIYRKWAMYELPRGFAIGPAGQCGSATGVTPPKPGMPTDPAQRALASCEQFAKSACKLYAIDDDVVWKQ